MIFPRVAAILLFCLFTPNSHAAGIGEPPDEDDTEIRWISGYLAAPGVQVETEKYYVRNQFDFRDLVADQVCNGQVIPVMIANFNAAAPAGYSAVPYGWNSSGSGAFRCRIKNLNDSGTHYNTSESHYMGLQHTQSITSCPTDKIFNWRSGQCQDPCPAGGTEYKWYEGSTALPSGGFSCKKYNDGFCTIKAESVFTLTVGSSTPSSWGFLTKYSGTFCHPDDFAPTVAGQDTGPVDANDDPLPTGSEGPTSTDVGNDDGTITTYNPDGSITTTNPDNSSVTTSADGNTTTSIDTDGVETTVGPNGTTTTTPQPGGGSITEHPDGSVTTTDSSGNSSTVDGDGYQVENPDGSYGGNAGSQIGDCESWIYNENTSNFQCIDGVDGVDDGEGGECFDDYQTPENECDTGGGNGGNGGGDGNTSYSSCEVAPECDEDDDWKCVQTQLTWENRCLYEWDGSEVTANSVLDSAPSDDGSELFTELNLANIPLDDSGFISSSEPESLITFTVPIFGEYQLDLSALYQIFTYLGYIIAALGYFHAARIVIEAL